MPGRQVSAQAVQAARLRARRAQRPEGLSRRGRALAPAVRDPSTCTNFCGKTDCRHVSAVLGERAGLRDPITLHNFYVPAGGDEPDPAVNPKFAHKLSFLDEMRDCGKLAAGAGPSARSWSAISTSRRSSTMSGATSRCSSGLAHADRMREAHRTQKGRQLGRRHARLRAGADQALHVVELSLARLADGRQGPPPRPCLGRARARRPGVTAIRSSSSARGWTRPSDHVPVTATIEL